MQPLIAVGNYSNFKELAQPSTMDVNNYPSIFTSILKEGLIFNNAFNECVTPINLYSSSFEIRDNILIGKGTGTGIEFGHLMHDLLTKAELASQAGTGVARDFVEMPSQIFENWAWDYEALSLFANHYLSFLTTRKGAQFS